jgi:hypothetical protein
MNRTLFTAIGFLILAGGSISAHHSYAAYDREHPVSIEGDIEQVAYENPHTVLTIRNATADYTVEWGALFQLQRWNVALGTLKVGDHVIVTGSAWRDPSVRKLSIITDIRRPSDGWHWSRQLQNPPQSR